MGQARSWSWTHAVSHAHWRQSQIRIRKGTCVSQQESTSVNRFLGSAFGEAARSRPTAGILHISRYMATADADKICRCPSSFCLILGLLVAFIAGCGLRFFDFLGIFSNTASVFATFSMYATSQLCTY
ncbi:hypothetical protein GQ44DRAFT_148040 [Phaeosphaeriaceae sp. PMI808]|nr:hypothetical protein GQ44DRAFT_148040 [Phaeosphaeriaceae sp. PMI808]